MEAAAQLAVLHQSECPLYPALRTLATQQRRGERRPSHWQLLVKDEKQMNSTTWEHTMSVSQYSYFGSRRLSPGGLSPMSETRGPPLAPRRIFVGGLHRSGTSILASLLKRHPQICALEVPTMPLSLENEGQHVQTLFPVDDALGGPGYFGFNPLAHMTECHTLANSESADALDREWAAHWGGAEDRAAEQGAEGGAEEGAAEGAEEGAAEGASRAPCRTSSSREEKPLPACPSLPHITTLSTLKNISTSAAKASRLRRPRSSLPDPDVMYS